MRVDEFSAKVQRYHCPKCGMRVASDAVRQAPPCALFVCDCGWQGDIENLATREFRLTGLDALRAVAPASPAAH